MIGPDQSLLFNFHRNHLRTRSPAQFIYFQNCLAHCHCHFIFRFSFWLTKLRETKIGCMIFCTMFSVSRQMKNNDKKLLFYIMFSLFITSATKTKNKKWNEPNILHDRLMFLPLFSNSLSKVTARWVTSSNLCGLLRISEL